jgi:predicted phosphodiesterase
MSTYRFVHLSDIHFGQEKNGTLVIHEDVRDELVLDAERMARDHGAAHAILVNGDVAYSGKPQEYVRAAEWLDKLCLATGCPRASVCVVPGNHDIDLDRIEYLANMVQKQLQAAPADLAQAHLEEFGKSEENNPLLPKLKAYREFAEQYGCGFDDSASPSWIRRFEFPAGHVLAIAGLTSVQVSDKTDRHGSLVLGNRQYAGLMRHPNLEYIVLVHHPLEWFKDVVQARQYLNSRARVLMFGHEHVPEINKISDSQDTERLVIFSGATNPEETNDVYGHTYNWMELSERVENGTQKLVIVVRPRVWVPVQTSFDADRARLGGPDSRGFTIACPRFQVNLKEGSEAAEVPGSEGLAGAAMLSDRDERFDRLRLLFWRYLNWRDRLSTLVRLDLLPSTPDRPLPQTLEKTALNQAKTDRKLAKLWDEVMQYVPVTEREANPFKVEE